MLIQGQSGISAGISLSFPWGEFDVLAVENGSPEGSVALRRVPYSGAPLVRLHSSCIFSEVFRSNLCECQLQLSASLELIARDGGFLFYISQEGRGIGLFNKLRAMEIERRHGLSTAEAFRMLGYDEDPRRYEAVVNMMRALGVPDQIRLITNNPRKIAALEEQGFSVIERIEPLLRVPRRMALSMAEKQRCLNHIPYENILVREE